MGSVIMTNVGNRYILVFFFTPNLLTTIILPLSCLIQIYFVIQIYLLQDRYDKMNDASAKTGGVLYFEPLRTELHDCFGAIKNVQPDSVFSSRQGMIVHTPPDDATDASNETETPGNCFTRS